MPEGDSVWNTAAALAAALTGEVITRSDFRVPTLATADLSGARIIESACRGKHLLLRVDRSGRLLTLHSHLRMDGSWRVFAPGGRWTGGPAHTIRVVLYTATHTAVGYHLHELRLVPTDREADVVGHLGPDLLGSDWDATEAIRRLAARPDWAIAEALLDQTVMAGVGNVYKNEICYLCGLSPWAPVSAVDDLAKVVDLAHRLLVANRGRGGRSTTGALQRGQTLHVYGRSGEPCRRCGTVIRRAGQGERVTYWCPTCQPGPAPD
jgi:endonuclease VIII